MAQHTTRHSTSSDLTGGVTLVSVSGSLDSATHHPLRAELDAHFEARPTALVLDMREVDFMGSSGIAVLINAHHRASRLGIPFAVVANNRHVLRPLQISQVDAALALYPTVEDAVAAVRLLST